MIDQMNELDLEQFEPLNNPLELTNISREDKDNDRNQKKDFLKNSPKSDEDYFVVPKIVEWFKTLRTISEQRNFCRRAG